MSDIQETIQEVIETSPTPPGKEDHLNSAIAIFVALSATFMAICNIKDGNICQAMAQAQAHSVSKYSQYQSKSTKQNLAETTLAMAQIQKAPEAILTHYQSEVERYEKRQRASTRSTSGSMSTMTSSICRRRVSQWGWRSLESPPSPASAGF